MYISYEIASENNTFHGRATLYNSSSFLIIIIRIFNFPSFFLLNM